MGLLLSILFSYVGAVELMFVVRDIVHQVGLHHEKMKFNRDLSKATASLHGLQADIRKSIKSAREQLYETDSIHSMADGVEYEDGYRILTANEQDLDKRWFEARANVAIQPSHMIEANDVENNSVISSTSIPMNQRSTTNEDQNDNNDRRTKINEPMDSDIANKDVSHLDSRKTDEQRRRKNYKASNDAMGSGGHSTESLQRRRSEDIDGETDNPWGELRPGSFHDASLWSRERAMSIAENEELMCSADEKLYHETYKRGVAKPLNSTSTTTSANDVTSTSTRDREHHVRIICFICGIE